MDRGEQGKTARRAVRRLDESLHQIEKAFEALMHDAHHGAPAPMSAAWADLETAESLGSTNRHWTRERIHRHHALTLARLAAASDNLAGVGTLIGRKGEGVYSPWSVARSVLETAGTAHWLLEPGLTTTVRLGRGLADRLDSIRGAARFGGLAGTSVDFERRARHVAGLARDLGLAVSGDGLKAIVGDGLPSKTDLVIALLGSELSPANYSLFSGWAHGEAWALLDAVQRSTDAPDPTDGGRTLRRPALSIAHYQFIAAIASRGFSNAVGRAISYFGWQGARWDEQVHRAFRAIGKPPMTPE